MGCCSSGRSHSKYSSYVNTIDPSPLQIEFNSSKLFGAIYSEAGIHSTVKHNSKVARESEHSNYFAVTTISSQVNEDSKEEFSALLASENSSIYLEIQAKYLSSQDN